MKVAVGLASVGEDVYIVVARDQAEAKSALRDTLPGGGEGAHITLGDLKVGRVYKNMAQEVYLHG